MLRLPTTLAGALLLLGSFARADVPAYGSNEALPALNRTLRVGWSTSTGQGVFTDGVELLAVVDANASASSSPYGLLLQFNETLGRNATPSAPFIAMVDCSAPQSDATSAAISNSTTTGSSNSTSSASNSTTASEVDVFALAASLQATAVLLYSSTSESCALNSSYLATNVSKPISIYTLASSGASNLVLEQFGAVDASHRFYNSTLLLASLANLTSLISNITPNALPNTGFLLAQITPSTTNGSSSPIVASIGRAPTAAPTSGSLPAATGTVSSTPGSSTPTGAATTTAPPTSWKALVAVLASTVVGTAVLVL